MGRIVSTCVFELGTVSKRQQQQQQQQVLHSTAQHSVCPRLARN